MKVFQLSDISLHILTSANAAQAGGCVGCVPYISEIVTYTAGARQRQRN
jgi:hypothetical protein